MPDSKFREILYNDIRTAGHGLDEWEQFLEFTAYVSSITPEPPAPLSMPPGASSSIVSAGVATQTAPLPEFEPAPQLDHSPPPLPEFSAPSPAAIQPPSPVAEEVPPSPTSETFSQPPEEPADLPQFDTFAETVVPPGATVAPPPDVFFPLPELPRAEAEPPPPERATQPEPAVEPPDQDEIQQIISAERAMFGSLPEFPTFREQPRQYRGPGPEDPTGTERYAREEHDREYASQGVVEAVLAAQAELIDHSNRVNDRELEIHQRAAADMANHERRLRTVQSGYERGISTMTDTNI